MVARNARPTVQELRLDPEAAVRRITEFISRQLASAGLERIVLGLSGGVDSALVAALCARAAGPESVHAYMMPYHASAPESRRDAEAVAGALGIDAQLVDISPMADSYFESRDLNAVRKGNVLARLRMIVLFDMAKASGALVAGTGNKTETYLGYCTWYGDSACSFAPLADLYKSQVWQLAEWLNLPESVLAKAPTADLWPGQTDEGELGFEYAVVDRILFALLERRLSPTQVMEFDAEVVGRVVEIMRRSEFKRQLPPFPRVQGLSSQHGADT